MTEEIMNEEVNEEEVSVDVNEIDFVETDEVATEEVATEEVATEEKGLKFKDPNNITCKEVSTFLDKDYKEIHKLISSISPSYKFIGGQYSKVDEILFRQICAVYGHGVERKGKTYVLAELCVGSDLKTISDMGKFDAEFIDPADLRAITSAFPANVDVALERAEILLKASPEKYKSIFNDDIKRDREYLHALLRGYKFAIVPDNFGRAIRGIITPHFDKIYVTDKFFNYFIVYDDVRIMVLYIIQ